MGGGSRGRQIGHREHRLQRLPLVPRHGTPVLRCDGLTLNMFREDRRNGRVGGTTAVFDQNWDALYFSKEVLPFTDKTYADDEQTPVYHHVGAYAYRPTSLARYIRWPERSLERLEGLEQLRLLEHGVKIRCVLVDARAAFFGS